MPGRCAAPPAPAMITSKPRPAASRAKTRMRSGVRCADTTRQACGTPSALEHGVGVPHRVPVAGATHDDGHQRCVGPAGLVSIAQLRLPFTAPAGRVDGARGAPKPVAHGEPVVPIGDRFHQDAAPAAASRRRSQVQPAAEGLRFVGQLQPRPARAPRSGPAGQHPDVPSQLRQARLQSGARHELGGRRGSVVARQPTRRAGRPARRRPTRPSGRPRLALEQALGQRHPLAQGLLQARRCTPPGRNRRGAPPLRSTMVDSSPTRHDPVQTSTSRSANSSATCRAAVGLMRPKRFADGAATPPAKAGSRRNASGWSGTRSPTVS